MCKSDKGKIVPVEAAMWGPELFLFAKQSYLLQNTTAVPLWKTRYEKKKLGSVLWEIDTRL